MEISIKSWAWKHVIMNMRISAHAVARTLLGNYEKHTPLTATEAARVRLALENTGIPNAVSRFSAGFIRAVLEAVTE